MPEDFERCDWRAFLRKPIESKPLAAPMLELRSKAEERWLRQMLEAGAFAIHGSVNNCGGTSFLLSEAVIVFPA